VPFILAIVCALFLLPIDNLLVRIHFIIVMIRWTGLAPWEFEFPFPGSLTSTSLVSEISVFAGADLSGRVVGAVHPGHRVCCFPAAESHRALQPHDIKWIRTSRLAIKNSTSLSRALHPGDRVCSLPPP